MPVYERDAAPEPAAGAADSEAGQETAVQETAVPAEPVSAPPSDWQAVLDDGREIAVSGVVLLGRNPSARPGEEDAQLIKIGDESRTVSKTHLAVGVDENGFWVMDRGSTNGSTVTSPDGFSRKCEPGDVVAVPADSIVSFGDHWLRVRHLASIS